jgi:hypothetical protein
VCIRHRRCISKYTILARRNADRLMPIMIAVGTTPLDPEGSFFIVRRQALAALADERASGD